MNVHGAAAASCVTVCVWPPAVIVADRDTASAFADAEYSIVPLALVPVAPEVIVSHDSLELALQEHEASLIVIDTLPVPPDADMLAVAGDSDTTVQGAAAAAWLTTCASPAIVTVAVRVPPVFADTTTDTLPLPVPDIGLTSIHSALSETLHAQLAALAVTATLCVPPLAPTL